MPAGDKSYKVNVAVSLVPIEETTLADGTTKRQDIHSLIDKVVGGSLTLIAGLTPATVTLKENVIVAPVTSLSVAQLVGRTALLAGLFVKLNSGGPIIISEAGGDGIKACLEAGQCVFLPLGYSFNSSTIYIGGVVTNPAHMDILMVG